jgi:hypothetical protein
MDQLYPVSPSLVLESGDEPGGLGNVELGTAGVATESDFGGAASAAAAAPRDRLVELSLTLIIFLGGSSPALEVGLPWARFKGASFDAAP